MVGQLQLVAVKGPEAAFAHVADTTLDDLGWHGTPDMTIAVAEHQRLVDLLTAAGAEVVELPADERTTPDSMYTHDPGLVTEAGWLPFTMGKHLRRGEALAMGNIFTGRDIPVLEHMGGGEGDAAAVAEGGDLIWLDRSTLIAGRGFRTNAGGIGAVRAVVEPLGVEVIEMHLPYWRGADSILHLMSFISMLDDDLAVVYPELCPVPLIELLDGRGIAWVEVPPQEFDSQGCNVLALGPRHVVALEGNSVTKARMEAAGCTVETFSGTQISLLGDGGPTCLTRPLMRAQT
ncbi:MAG: dimethylargininase [Candidatus Poriferisodalaceae bacterium]|jgi:dimethylargininase